MPINEGHGVLSWAARQLGSLGSGNHFVELCEDEQGYAWIVLHSGSRGPGTFSTGYNNVPVTSGSTTVTLHTSAGPDADTADEHPGEECAGCGTFHFGDHEAPLDCLKELTARLEVLEAETKGPGLDEHFA